MLQKYRLWTGWTRISIFASVNYGYVSYAALVNDEGLVLTIWGEPPPFFSHNYNIPPFLPTDGQLCVDMKRHQKKVYIIKNMLMNEIDLIFFAGACQLKSKQIHAFMSIKFWKVIHFCFSTILRIAKIAWFASHMMMHFTPYRNQFSKIWLGEKY